MKEALVFSKQNCPQCDQAKAALVEAGYALNVKMVGVDCTREELLELVPTARSVPQVFIDGTYIGGLKEVMAKIK